MRRIINSTYVSLDSLIELLDRWHFDYLDDASNKVEWDQLLTSDALLMGRRTYEGFAEVWPSRDGDLAEEVAKLKQQPGQDILMYGFGPVAQTLQQHGLLDEVRLWVHPVFVGSGSPSDMLFREGNSARLRLALHYRPA